MGHFCEFSYEWQLGRLRVWFFHLTKSFVNTQVIKLPASQYQNRLQLYLHFFHWKLVLCFKRLKTFTRVPRITILVAINSHLSLNPPLSLNHWRYANHQLLVLGFHASQLVLRQTQTFWGTTCWKKTTSFARWICRALSSSAEKRKNSHNYNIPVSVSI